MIGVSKVKVRRYKIVNIKLKKNIFPNAKY